jgi:cytochrome P450
MWHRFPPRMRRALVSSLHEAARRGSDIATPEDLLAAILDDPESAGAYVLEQCGVDAAQIVSGQKPANGKFPIEKAERLNADSIKILRAAVAASDRLHHDHVGTEHLVAAFADFPDLAVGRRLIDAGLTPIRVRDAIRNWIDDGMPRRRGRWGWTPVRNRFLAAVLRPLQKTVRFPPLLWKIYHGKSLAHPKFVSDPYPIYASLRAREPVRKDPLAPVWILTRYDDVMEMLRNPRYLKDPFAAQRLPPPVRRQLQTPGEEDIDQPEIVSMLFLDPPDHTRVRGVFARAFTPASLSQLRPKIESIAKARLDAVEAAGRMDLIADLAYPLPVIVIAEMLGFPSQDYPRMKVWSDALAASLSLRATPDQQSAAGVAWSEMREYFQHVAARVRASPGNTILSRLLDSENEPGGLSFGEIFTNCVLLLAAGHETTTNLIGNGMLALLRNRDQWELLTRDPSLIESAVEELLRYDSPVQWTSRLAAEPTQLNGQSIASGEVILGCVGAANRDPAKFPNPNRLDIRRSDNRHLAFGIGIHYCIGAALARIEAQIAIGQLAARFPKMRLATRKLRWMKGLTFRGVKKLPVLLR